MYIPELGISLEPPDSYRTLVRQVCGKSLEVRD